MLRRAAFSLLVACCAGAFPACGAGDYYPPPDSEGGWRSLTNQNTENLRKVAGMDRAKLDEAFQLAEETTQNGGLIVVRHGYRQRSKVGTGAAGSLSRPGYGRYPLPTLVQTR
jgi:hypothetical protein